MRSVMSGDRAKMTPRTKVGWECEADGQRLKHTVLFKGWARQECPGCVVVRGGKAARALWAIASTGSGCYNPGPFNGCSIRQRGYQAGMLR